MPNFLCDEMKDQYLGMLYGIKKKERIFTITKSYLHHEMDRGAKSAGVKRIRIHDLRHSQCTSHLIDMGFSAVAIADRVWGMRVSRSPNATPTCFPSKQTEMADKLDSERDGSVMSAKNLTPQPLEEQDRGLPGIPEENEQIGRRCAASGLTKQDYITKRLLCRDVVVQGNPRCMASGTNWPLQLGRELWRIRTGQRGQRAAGHHR